MIPADIHGHVLFDGSCVARGNTVMETMDDYYEQKGKYPFSRRRSDWEQAADDPNLAESLRKEDFLYRAPSGRNQVVIAMHGDINDDEMNWHDHPVWRNKYLIAEVDRTEKLKVVRNAFNLRTFLHAFDDTDYVSIDIEDEYRKDKIVETISSSYFGKFYLDESSMTFDTINRPLNNTWMNIAEQYRRVMENPYETIPPVYV